MASPSSCIEAEVLREMCAPIMRVVDAGPCEVGVRDALLDQRVVQIGGRHVALIVKAAVKIDAQMIIRPQSSGKLTGIALCEGCRIAQAKDPGRAEVLF